MTMTIFPPKFQSWLKTFLDEQGASAGTVHLHIREKLSLAAAINIPAQVRNAVAKVPRGQGVAGLALEREEPTVDDDEGTIALPVRGKEGGVRAVVGLAFADERKLGAEELEALSEAAASLPHF